MPRFSRKAIAGALWAPLFLLVIAAIAPAFLVETVVELPSGQQLPGKPTLLMLVVGGIALLVGGSAIFGTTILGLLAIRDIRHSQGRIVGMPLALADALLFPLLLLDLLIAGASMMVAIASGAELLVAVFAPVALVVCLIVDGLVILWAWRAVHAPTALGTSTTLDLPAAAALPSKPLGKSPAKDSRVGRVGKRSPLVILPAGVLVLVILLGSVLAMRIANRPSDTVLLMSAIRAGDTVAAESLLESHPELIEARDDEQLTPLNWAALRGNVSLVRYLANRGAEIDTVDVYRETPLFKAAGMGHHAVAGVLLMEGAAVDHVNEDGRTPLMLAAGRGDLPTVQLLVEYGADFNHVDAAGESVLIRAVAGGHRRVTQFLLAKGADVQHRDDRGQGVLQYALTESMYQWLKDAGAPMGPPEWFREGYAMALAGRYAEAAELLERVRADAEPLTTIFARVNGWQYELFEPQLIVSLMVAECYARGGEAERAREVLKEFQKVWPTGMNIALYERRQESPGHKVVEQYQLDWSIFQQFRESPDRTPKLTLNRHEVVNENGQHTRVSSSLVSVAGMFHR